MPLRKQPTRAMGGNPPGASAASKEGVLQRSLSQMQEEARDQKSCSSLPFTALLWVVFIVTQVNHRQVKLQNSMQLALNGVLTSSVTISTSSSEADAAVAENSMAANGRRLLSVKPSSSVTSKTLTSVSNLAGIWEWLSQSLVPQIWAEGADGRGVLSEFNRVVGGVRVMNTRLANGSCPGSERLSRVYNLSCYSSALEGTEGGGITASLKNKLPGIRSGTGGLQTFWFDLAQDEATVQAQIQQLWDKDWLTPATQSVWVQSVILNAQVALLAITDAHFELDRAGRLTTYAKVHTLPTSVYGDDWMVWCGDVFLVLLLLWLGLAELIRVCRACHKKCPRTCCAPMRALNWVVVVYGLGFSAFFGYLAYQLQLLSESLGVIPEPPEQAAALASGDPGWGERHQALEDIFNEVNRLSELLRACETNTFWYSLFLMMKFFEAFEGSPRLAVITATLRGCFVDMVHFLVVFLVVFMNFAIGAYFLFGHQLKEWSDPGLSINTSFRTLMGDFDFQEMFRIAPVSSVTWFWLFMLLIFLVMLNMLLAIILDTYSEVKDSIRDQSTLWEQAASIKSEVVATFLSRKDEEGAKGWIEKNSDIEAFMEDGLGIEKVEEGNARMPKLRDVAHSEMEPSPPGMVDYPHPPATPSRLSPLANAALRAQRGLPPASPGSTLRSNDSAGGNRRKKNEDLAWQIKSLTEELEEIKRLPVLFKQLEDTCWRYFWLEASTRNQSTHALAKILTEAVPAPNSKLAPTLT
mmetsp:Transcript_77564/g.214319  ORF Transcript_77564/g.214319 Transcript_77564/m.214319 type:complete len:751 (+) Transcript_77564:95-2347(+)